MTEADQIFPYFRLVSLFVAIILLAAFRILFFYPDETNTMFAWKVSPHMTSYLIGAGYLGGAYFFGVVAVFGHRLKWHEVRLAIIPVTAFTITMAGITIVHWDLFNNDKFPGQLWDFLYFSLPFILPAILIHHQRRLRIGWGSRQGHDSAAMVDIQLKRLYFVVGIFLFVYGCILYFLPSKIVPTWPWSVTTVTTMAIGGWLILPGVAGLLLPIDPRRSAWRLLLQAQLLSVTVILISMYIALDELNRELYTYVFAGSLFFIILMIVGILSNVSVSSLFGMENTHPPAIS